MSKSIVRTIRAGYTLTDLESGEEYFVLTSMKMRGRQSYRVRCEETGAIRSFGRDAVLALQEQGTLSVTLKGN